jgi:hypothetical protein
MTTMHPMMSRTTPALPAPDGLTPLPQECPQEGR